MLVKKEDINISHRIIGFHSFTKDHNYPKYRGDLINFFERELELTLDVFNLGREHIVKTMDRDRDLFEIKLTPQALIYQDTLTLQKMIDNSMKFLNCWKEYSNLVSLRLVGLVRNFTIEIEPNKINNKLNIVDRFFNDLNYGEKYITSDFGLRFNKMLEDENYNIHLKMSETLDPEYKISGVIDFNKIASKVDSPHSEKDISNIFKMSTSYFENDFIELLNG